MKNFKRSGNTTPIAAPSGGVTSGQGVLVGGIFGIASGDAAEGETVELALIGVFAIAKTSALAISVGDKVYWDNAAKVVNKTASGNTLVGVAVAAAANPSATVDVRLNGVSV
ncbi:DUF2190 family protein [Ancylobacter terrae]|uniref:DUF2190 family protein n=1 Tax=Ancylobacter sp. sgz301288 TaxID=3342077 RepID=UPI00385DC198